MTKNNSLATIRERNKIKRLTGWALLYLVLIALFIFAIYWQTKRVNTLNFANGEIQLTTSKTKYTVGDSISYTLKNDLSEPITLVNTCPQNPLFAYEWSNNSWIRIHDTASSSACLNQPKQRILPVGGTYTQSFDNWPNLFNKPGIYRIVGLATNYTALPYADFQVVAKPVPVKVQTQTQVIIQKVITPIYIPVPVTSGSGGGGGGDSGGGGGGDN
jgi:hypothetical protein